MGGKESKGGEVDAKWKEHVWIKKHGFADLEKIQKRIVTQTEYEREMVEEFRAWNKEEFEEIKSIDPNVVTKLKPLVRKGIPNEYKRDVIIKLFNVNLSDARFNYENDRKVVLKDTIELEYAPTFTGHNQLEEVLPIHFITKEGIEAEKRILFILNKLSSVDYSPLIPVILSFLLIYLGEAEAYAVMKTVMERSKKENSSREIRWHLTFRKIEFARLINAYLESYYKLSRNKGRKNLEHFKKIKFEARILVESLFSGFFTEYVQFHLLMKIFMIYLCEGTKILFRMSYAIMKRLHEVIISVPEPASMLNTLHREGPRVINDSGYILEWGFKMALTRYNNTYTEQKTETEVTLLKAGTKSKVMHKHHMDVPSGIVTDSEVEYLFQFVHIAYQVSSLQLVFATRQHGCSLQTLYAFASKMAMPKGMMLFVMSRSGAVFGGFCNKMFEVTEIYHIGNEHSFVFSLRPKREVFPAAGVNTYYLCCGSNGFSMGAKGDGEAIRVHDDLQSGSTASSETFANSPLSSPSDFEIIQLEVYALV